MARLSQICLAALALMVAVTYAAPCTHADHHEVTEHHNMNEGQHELDNHNGGNMDHDMDNGDSWDENDEYEGDEGDDEWENDDDCIDVYCTIIDHGNPTGPHHGGRDEVLPPVDGSNGGGNEVLPPVGGSNGGGNEVLPPVDGSNGGGNEVLPPVDGSNGGGDEVLPPNVVVHPPLQGGKGIVGPDGGFGSLVDIKTGYIGTGDINAQGLLSGAITAPNANLHDLVNVISGN